MSATTDRQLGGAKKRASVTPGTRAKKVGAKKIGTSARLAVAVKAAKVRCPTNRKTSLVSAKVSAETTVLEEVTPSKCEGEEDYASKSSEAKSSGGVATVKTLTEAGKKRLVNKLLGLAETQATQGSFKITPADLIRLMQLHKEMSPQKDRKVTVQWIEDTPE